MVPEFLRLADYDLGHDDRARECQSVSDALGPRFHDWQLKKSATESWEECARHKEILDVLLPMPDARRSSPTVHNAAQARETNPLGDPTETDLFGRPVEKKPSGRGRE